MPIPTTRGQCLRQHFHKAVVWWSKATAHTTTTARWCDYCCHDIPGTARAFEGRFHARLRFCGEPCMLAYRVRVLRNFPPGSSFMPGVAMAPPKCCLAGFGGWMSIDEFRSCTKTYEELPPKVIVPNEVSAAQLAVSRSAPAQKRMAAKEIKYGDMPRNETVRLKRRKCPKNVTVMDRLGFNNLKQ